MLLEMSELLEHKYENRENFLRFIIASFSIVKYVLCGFIQCVPAIYIFVC